MRLAFVGGFLAATLVYVALLWPLKAHMQDTYDQATLGCIPVNADPPPVPAGGGPERLASAR